LINKNSKLFCFIIIFDIFWKLYIKNFINRLWINGNWNLGLFQIIWKFKESFTIIILLLHLHNLFHMLIYHLYNIIFLFHYIYFHYNILQWILIDHFYNILFLFHFFFHFYILPQILIHHFHNILFLFHFHFLFWNQ